jgi:superfamily II DNA or RNA helicase
VSELRGAFQDALRGVLREMPTPELTRGRRYAAEGRVRIASYRDGLVRATVRGSAPYQVVLHLFGKTVRDQCECQAWHREGLCKHVVATATVFLEDADLEESAAAPVAQTPAQQAARFEHAAAFEVVARLELYCGRALPAATPGTTFGQWQRNVVALRQETRGLVAAVLERYLPEVEAARQALLAFQVDGGETLLRALADAYAFAAASLARHAMPLPDDARFAGWETSFDAATGTITVAPQLARRSLPALRITIAPDPDAPSPIVHWTQPHAVDAAELSALRWLVRTLADPSAPLTAELTQHLARARWEHLLDRVTGKPVAPQSVAELGFVVIPVGRSARVSLVVRSGRGKAARWRAIRLSALLDGSLSASPLEREIGGFVVSQAARGNEVYVDLGSPLGFATLERIGQHPRVFGDSEGSTTLRILTGNVTLELAHRVNAMARARFVVAGHAVPMEALEPVARSQSAHLAFAVGDVLVAGQLASGLRPWVKTALDLGPAALEFPDAALPRLRAALLPLVPGGLARIPSSVLGTEIAAQPRAALAIDWAPTTSVELMVEVAPGAPLLRAGEGPPLLTFTRDGVPLFVKRAMAQEEACLAPLRAGLGAWVEWEDATGGATGTTVGLEATLALLDFADANPLEIRIEMRSGMRPTTVKWERAEAQLSVDRSQQWFALRASVGAAGSRTKVPLGDILQAIRDAQRYVPMGDSRYLELTSEVREALLPMAFAAVEDDESAKDGAPIRLHEGFGSALVAARAYFGALEGGVDVDAIEARFGKRKRVRTPAKIERGELRDYQRDGVGWMQSLATWAPGCVLADDMGLGKTVQTAAVLLARKKLGPALVVAPASVSFNWKAELSRFAPSLRVHWFNEDRELAIPELGAGDVVVVSYGLVQKRAKSFARQWPTLVLDEVQYLKNHLAKRSTAIRDLSRDFTIALSGTPMENHLGELWSVVNLVFPGLLGSEPSFRARFRQTIEGHDSAPSLGALNLLLRPFLLRRTRAEVLAELPPRQDIVEYVDLDAEETRRYENFRHACEMQFSKKDRRVTSAQQKIQILAALTRLRQLACHPGLVDASFTGESSKLKRLRTLCLELRDQRAAALIFSQFTTLLGRARADLEHAGLRVGYLDGATPLGERRRLVDAFQAGAFDVFCISLTAGGTGLNLTRASYVVHLDPWWNPAVEEQANARAHRMGQDRAVTAYRIVARGTIEEGILSLHARKRDLVASVLDGKSTTTPLAPEELLDLLRFRETLDGS